MKYRCPDFLNNNSHKGLFGTFVRFMPLFEKRYENHVRSITDIDFNNLIGEPKFKYETSYTDLNKLRQLFFEKVGNEPDLDKYLDFYKWFDSALGSF